MVDRILNPQERLNFSKNYDGIKIGNDSFAEQLFEKKCLYTLSEYRQFAEESKSKIGQCESFFDEKTNSNILVVYKEDGYPLIKTTTFNARSSEFEGQPNITNISYEGIVTKTNMNGYTHEYYLNANWLQKDYGNYNIESSCNGMGASINVHGDYPFIVNDENSFVHENLEHMEEVFNKEFEKIFNQTIPQDLIKENFPQD